jgi:hypothetical protein
MPHQASSFQGNASDLYRMIHSEKTHNILPTKNKTWQVHTLVDVEINGLQKKLKLVSLHQGQWL